MLILQFIEWLCPLSSVSSNIAQAFLSAVLEAFLDTELQVHVHVFGWFGWGF